MVIRGVLLTMFNFEEFDELYTKPCPISSPYHDLNKCKIIVKTSGEHFHRYINIPGTRGKDCKLFVDLIKDEKYEYTGDINGGITLDLQIPNNYKMQDVISYGAKSRENFREVLKSILLSYKSFKTGTGKFHFDKNSLYDIGIINGSERLYFFRPIKLIHSPPNHPIQMTDRDMEVEFLSNFREFIFIMLKKYMKVEQENKIYDKRVNNKIYERRVKDARSCTLESWLKFPEFKCASNDPSTCPIYKRYFVNGVWSGCTGMKLCEHVIERLLDDTHQTGAAENYLQFECQFSRLVEHKNPQNNPINSLFDIIGHRVAWHRLCIHKNFLTISWMRWVINDMFQLSLEEFQI